MALIIKQRIVSDIVVLDLAGRLWILDLPLWDMVNGILGKGWHNFILNLASVDYIDSSGLGQLISIWTSIRSRGGHMTLVNPTKDVNRLFQITRLNTVFEICEQEPAAVQKLAKLPNGFQ
jgi:anti-sigma B factor antagonist